MSGKFVNYESRKSDQQTWRTLLSNNQGARIKQKVLKNEIKKIKTVRYVESGSSSLFNQCLVAHDCINSATDYVAVLFQGCSITITTLTDFLAFLIGSTTVCTKMYLRYL